MNPDDLRADAQHDPEDDPDFEAEEVISERTVDAKKAVKPTTSLAPPRSTHLKPGSSPVVTPPPRETAVTAVKPSAGPVVAAPVRVTTPVVSSAAEKIRIAKQKGYEGDPCSNCQQLTLVRSGACMKCDTCGETSGCS